MQFSCTPHFGSRGCWQNTKGPCKNIQGWSFRCDCSLSTAHTSHKYHLGRSARVNGFGLHLQHHLKSVRPAHPMQKCAACSLLCPTYSFCCRVWKRGQTLDIKHQSSCSCNLRRKRLIKKCKFEF